MVQISGNYGACSKPELTGQDVKTLYEQQPDTNAFTDGEKQSLQNLVNQKITGEVTLTVGPSGDFETLIEALDFLKTKKIAGFVHVVVQTKVLADVTLDRYNFDHTDAQRVGIKSALNGNFPAASELTGNQTDDRALIESRFSGGIYLPGAGDSGSYGLALPYGIGYIKDIFVFSDTRYSIDLAFNGSHGNSTDGRSIKWSNICVDGGVWGVITKGAVVSHYGPALFSNQGSGGPFDFIDSNVRLNTFTTECFCAASGVKYVANVEGGGVVFDDKIEAIGPFYYGIYATKGANIEAAGCSFDGVTHPITANPGTHINFTRGEIKNANPQNTVGVLAPQQIGFGDQLNASGALIHAGFGATVTVGYVTVSGSEAKYLLHSMGGAFVGYNKIHADDCKFTLAAARYYASGNSYLAIEVTNPRAGSLNQCLALGVSQVRVGENSGVSFGPALDNFTNGNLFASVG